MVSNEISERIQVSTWHPKENTFAVARSSSLFLYTEKRSSSAMEKSGGDRSALKSS